MNVYDDRARLAFHFAREESAELGHAVIDPEHLLLGLMREGGAARRVLGEFGATLGGFRRQVEETVGRGDGLPRDETAAITLRARRVMEFAGDERGRLGGETIGTLHLLLGLLREGDGVAFRVLRRLAGPEAIRASAERALGLPPAAWPPTHPLDAGRVPIEPAVLDLLVKRLERMEEELRGLRQVISALRRGS